MVAWHTGDWEGARRLAAEAERLAPNPSELADLKGMLAHLDGGWEQHSRRQLTHVWDSPELAGRVFDAYLCVTEYVLTAGDPYDRVAAFAKRLRAQAHQAGARRGEAFAATVLGETELFTDNLEAARAHLVDAARLSREVGAVGGESLARMRLGEALLHLGDRAGRAGAARGGARARAHLARSPSTCCSSSTACCCRSRTTSAEALALIERAETLFDPRWVCQFCPTGYHVAAATVCARAGRLERGREFLERAERGAGRWPRRSVAGGGGGGARRAAARRGRPARRRGRAAPRRRGLRRGGPAAQRATGARGAGTAPRSGDRRLGRFREGVPATLPACIPTPQTSRPGELDPEELDRHIAEMYRDVANEAGRDLHFPTGRPLAEALGYPADLLDPAARRGRELVRGRGLPPRPRASAPGRARARPRQRLRHGRVRGRDAGGPRGLGHRRRHHARAARQVRAPRRDEHVRFLPRAHRGAALRRTARSTP